MWYEPEGDNVPKIIILLFLVFTLSMILIYVNETSKYKFKYDADAQGEVPQATLPNPEYTPGEVRNMTEEEICKTKWGKDKRRVTVEMKMNVAEWYNVPWDSRLAYEFDHLIPRCMGGADSEKNLFPQPRSGKWNAYVKDRLEMQACIMVCKGELELKETQSLFAKDWVKLYKRVFD